MLNLAGGTAYSGREPVNNMTGKSLIISGAGKRIRTADLLITNQLLYQLSYPGI